MSRESKLPPHCLEAEQAVLGGILRGYIQGDDAHYKKVEAILRPTNFYQDRHRGIFETMGEMASRGEPIDLITLPDRLRAKGQLEAVGGVTYLSQLLDATPTAGHVRNYAQIVHEKARLRALRKVAQETLDRIDGGKSANEIVPIMLTALTSVDGMGTEGTSILQPVSKLEALPVEWLIEGLVPLGMVTLLSGRDTLGKTLLAQEMVHSTLMGKPLLGRWEVNHPGPVAALFLDDSPSVTLERLADLGIRDHPELYMPDWNRVDLADPLAMLVQLEKESATIDARLIVLDALYLLVPSSRDAANDQSRMKPLMQALSSLSRRTGAAVPLVAHDRKDGTDVAGSHVIRATSKAILRLTLPKGLNTSPDEVPDTPDRVLKVQGNLVRSSTWRLRVEGAGRWTFLGTQKEYCEGETERVVLDFLERGGQGTADDIRKEVNRSANEVRSVLKALAEGGEVEVDEVVTRGRPKTIYRAKAFRLEQTSQSDASVEKSEAQALEIQGLEKHGDFSTQNPIPKGGDSVEKSLPLLPEVPERPSLDRRTWPKG